MRFNSFYMNEAIKQLGNEVAKKLGIVYDGELKDLTKLVFVDDPGTQTRFTIDYKEGITFEELLKAVEEKLNPIRDKYKNITTGVT